MGKVLCFGELLVRLSPPTSENWISVQSFAAHLGGAELNVAIALALWNVPTVYYTALPQNFIGDDIISAVAAKNIDTSRIARTGDRVGTYYLKQGADVKSASLIYDRAHSSFANITLGSIDWAIVLNGCEYLHFSAICPALTAQTAAICKELLEFASNSKIKISIDLNYRARLWKYGALPPDVMPDLVNHCDIVMGNIWAVESLLGIKSPLEDSKNKSLLNFLDASKQCTEALRIRFSKVKTIALTYRLEKQYFATLSTDDTLVHSRIFDTEQAIDKVGSGDCFMGALIYGIYHGKSPKEIIKFAAAAAVSKMFVKGDATNKTVAEIENFNTN